MTLREFLHVIHRRKWIVVQTIVLVVFVAVAASSQQPKLYRSTARVLLSWQNLANQLTGVSGGGNVTQQPDRAAQTQAAIARTTVLAQRVLDQIKEARMSPGGFLAESSVNPNPNADVLVFTVTDRSRPLARRLVNEYALQYTLYRKQLDTTAILRARASVKASLKQLQAQGDRSSQLYSDLVDRDQTLAELEALQTANASVLQQANGAAQTQPNVKRDAMLAVILGLLLGIGFAYLWETLDTKVRSADEIGERLGGLPLLGRIPPGNKRFDADERLVMIAEPNGIDAETFLMLRTNLEFVLLGTGIQTLMFTSAIEQEGKSTTAANLAVALARGGRKVVLVDLDLRSPRIGRFFRSDSAGLVQVALGHADLDQALQRVDLHGVGGQAFRPRTNGMRSPSSVAAGSLHVLAAGGSPPDRSSFFESQALASIFDQLKERADLVIVDAPPALQVGDAMALSPQVDGIVVVARINRVRRPMLLELERLLAMSPARAVGFVATGATGEITSEYPYRVSQQAIDLEAARSKAGASG